MSSTVIPCLRYRDAPRMIEWLCSTFDFVRHLVVEDGKGGIAHAQLTLGPGIYRRAKAAGGESSLKSRTRTTAAGCFPAGTRRATSGTSAPTTPGVPAPDCNGPRVLRALAGRKPCEPESAAV